MQLPKTRAEALERGLTRYFTGKACKHGHVSERFASGASCVECLRKYAEANPEKKRESDRKYAEANREKLCEAARKWGLANPEKIRENSRKYREANLEKTREVARKYNEDNPERIRKYREANRERAREVTRKWAAANPGRNRANCIKRQAKKLNATPSWLTPEHHEQMVDLHAQAVIAEQLTGVKHHVDHIEPLQGKDRCGLHVPWNLQVLEARENSAKGNRPVRHVLWKKL